MFESRVMVAPFVQQIIHCNYARENDDEHSCGIIPNLNQLFKRRFRFNGDGNPDDYYVLYESSYETIYFGTSSI